MAYVILQGAIRKLEERHRIELLTEVGRGMKLINTGKENFNLEVREIGDEIRPPMITIPAYVERRRSRSHDAIGLTGRARPRTDDRRAGYSGRGGPSTGRGGARVARAPRGRGRLRRAGGRLRRGGVSHRVPRDSATRPRQRTRRRRHS